MKIRRLGKFGDGGGVLLEFALVFPLFITLVFMLIEVMLLTYVSTGMESGLRMAARNSITGFAVTGETREQAICRLVQERTLGFVRCDAEDTTLSVAAFNSLTAAATYDPFAPPKEGEEPPLTAGGPTQVVVYSIAYQPPEWTPIAKLLNLSDRPLLRAQTMVRNEAYEPPQEAQP